MSKRRGFTLIELLVVIAIIALLMAILMPALQRVKSQAQSITCQARLRQWGFMFKFYIDDNDGYFNEGWGNDQTTLWPNALRPYYKDNWDMLLCPTATRLALAGDFGTFKADERILETPGGGSQRYIFSYGINSWTNYMHGDRNDRLEEWFWKSALDVKGANQVPVFADSTWHDAWPRHTDTPSQTMDSFGIGNQGTSEEMDHFVIDRHGGFVNFLFMDWSVRHVGLKENWTLKWHRQFEQANIWTRAGGARPDDWPEWLRRYKDY